MRWVIRPMHGKFAMVAIHSDGREIMLGTADIPNLLPTEHMARAYIRTHYANGTAFPFPTNRYRFVPADRSHEYGTRPTLGTWAIVA